MMRRFTILPILLSFCWLPSASAQPNTYLVTVDTSSIKGTTGALDFNFNPGLLVTQAADAQVTDFVSDGTAGGSAVTIGDVSGMLLSGLTFDNGKAFNDYFDSFTFGTNLSFYVTLGGAAVTAPNGTASSGSTFAFSMFSNAAGTKPVLTTNPAQGFAFVVNVNLDGTTTAISYVQFVGKPPVTVTATRLSSYPNPSQLGQLVTILAVVVPAPGSTSTPTGIVTFFDGLTSLGSAPLNDGVATIMVPFDTIGQQGIAAQYGGDSNFSGNTSPVLTQVVQ
jgi:Bacterial Ig-like domain (group 3)